MFTRNHPTDKPENQSNFRILTHLGAEITVSAHYCTTSQNEFGSGYAFWRIPEDPAAMPVCVAVFARDGLDAIILSSEP